MELNDRLNTHFPDLVGKELNPQIPLETDESGKITNGVKILAIHLIFTNKDAQDPDALCNGFRLVDPNNLESGFLREMDINDFREDPVNHEYFHTKLKQGESKEIWVGFFVTDDEIKNRKAALYFNLTEGDENNRQIPLDFTKIKKTY